MSYQDQVVWVTGASSGIGLAMAKGFHQAGARLILSSRRVEALEAAKAQLGGDPDRIAVLPLDLEQPEALFSKVEEAIKIFGHVDILINNGGISQRSLAKDTVFSVYRKLIEVDYLGQVALTQAILPHMRERDHGHVVAITSVAGLVGTPWRSGYAGAKFALTGYCEAVRFELIRDGSAVRVHVVAPGSTRTDVSVNALSADGTPNGVVDPLIANGIPPEDVVKAAFEAIEKDERLVIAAHPREKAAWKIKRWFPRRYDKLMSKMQMR